MTRYRVLNKDGILDMARNVHWRQGAVIGDRQLPDQRATVLLAEGAIEALDAIKGDDAPRGAEEKETPKLDTKAPTAGSELSPHDQDVIRRALEAVAMKESPEDAIAQKRKEVKAELETIERPGPGQRGWYGRRPKKHTLGDEIYDDRDLTRINSINIRQMLAFNDMGYTTIQDLANADPEMLRAVKFIGPVRAREIIEEARALAAL